MDYFPIFLKLTDRDCLVVGGGEVASRKVNQLRKAGACITVVAPEICEPLQRLVEQEAITHLAEKYDSSHLNSKQIVVAATSDNQVNQEISQQAQAKCIPVNVVDDPALCSFIVPSTIDRHPVQIAISTGGASPVLARLLRSRLETFIPSGFGRLGALMRDFREQVKQKFPSIDERRRFWERILNGPITEMFLAGQDKAGLDALQNELEQEIPSYESKGEVYLVGGGPGDPDLLTFRALRLIQQAEVVIYDRLVSKDIVDLARRDADFIYVGKKRDQHTVPQEEINDLLVKYALEGKRVLRLKGGDPFIFGRGGEEIEQLSEAGVSFQIVPGITAAAACASYAGIPLTHRDYAQSCIFVTGHMKDGDLNLNWPSLVQPNQTLAIYMGVAAAESLCNKLIEHGMSSSTPVALVERGSLNDQRVFIETIQSLPGRIEQENIRPPSLIIIGEVVALNEKLAWFNENS